MKNMMGMNTMNMMNMNNMMGGNPMMMGMGMSPMMGGMNIKMMTPEQRQKYKQQQMMLGYKIGKMMALQKKKALEKKNKQTSDNNTTNSEPSNNGKIKVNFVKGGATTPVEMETTAAIFELIYEFCEKTNTSTGTFKFGNQTLDPNDSRNLSEAGLKNGSTITVS
jgi:hypothetical protein